MEPHQLTDEEREEVLNTMLDRVQKDHPAWQWKHKYRYAKQLTERFAKDFAAGKIIVAKEVVADDN